MVKLLFLFFRHKNMLFLLLLVITLIPIGFVLADGEAGFAMSFDGVDDYVVFEETNTIFGGTGWKDTKTVSMWIKPEGSASICQFDDPVQCDAVFGDRPRWWGISRGIIGVDDRIWVWNYDGSIDKFPVRYTVGEWMHITMVHDNGVMYVYKNAQLVGSLASGTTQSPDTGAVPVLHVGGMIVGPNNWLFEGDIDEVRLYNTALSQSELEHSLFDELVGNETGLVGYYTMNALDGSTLPDDRVDGVGDPVSDPHDGTLSGETIPPAPFLTVSGAFDKPVSSDQNINVDEDDQVSFSLFGLDKQEETLTFEVLSTPTSGQLTGTPPNLNYAPNENYFGSDQFSYQVSDSSYTSDEGLITITINAINDPPTADDKDISTPVDTPVAVTLTGADVDGPVLRFEITSNPTHGYLSGTLPNYIYTPYNGYIGPDQFTYRAYDRIVYSDTATVSITVTSDEPVLDKFVYLPVVIR